MAEQATPPVGAGGVRMTGALGQDHRIPLLDEPRSIHRRAFPVTSSFQPFCTHDPAHRILNVADPTNEDDYCCWCATGSQEHPQHRDDCAWAAVAWPWRRAPEAGEGPARRVKASAAGRRELTRRQMYVLRGGWVAFAVIVSVGVGAVVGGLLWPALGGWALVVQSVVSVGAMVMAGWFHDDMVAWLRVYLERGSR